MWAAILQDSGVVLVLSEPRGKLVDILNSHSVGGVDGSASRALSLLYVPDAGCGIQSRAASVHGHH